MADDDAGAAVDMGPPQASAMTAKVLKEELEKRGLKITGFPDEDIRTLQAVLDIEWQSEKEERLRQRKGALVRKRAEEEAARLQRWAEKQRKEEEEALASDAHAAFLMDLIRSNRTPPELALRCSYAACRALIKGLGGNTSLRRLDIVGCGLGDDVGNELGTILASNACLRAVDADYNDFGPVACAAIAEGLRSNSTLVSLSLEHNPLCRPGGGGGGSGGAAAAAAAEDLGTAVSADVMRSDTSPRPGMGAGGGGPGGGPTPDLHGVSALAEVVRAHPSLRALNLFGTGLGREGGRLVAEAVAANPRMASVQLSPLDDVRPEDVERIVGVLAANGAALAAAQERAKEEADMEWLAGEAGRAAAEAERRAAAKEAWWKHEEELRAKARVEAQYAEAKREAMFWAEMAEADKDRRARKLLEEQAKAGKGDKGKKK